MTSPEEPDEHREVPNHAQRGEGATHASGTWWSAGSGLGWLLILVSVFLLFVVTVEAARGGPLELSTLGLAILALPVGVLQVAAARGMTRLSNRAEATGRLLALPAALMLIWAELINNWVAGRGTDWLLLAGGMCLLAAVGLAFSGAKWPGGQPRPGHRRE